MIGYPKPKTKKKKRDVVKDKVYYLVYSRDKICQMCGTPYNLELHHIVYRSEDRSRINDPTNLIMLCIKCHQLVHSNKHKYQPILINKITKKFEKGEIK